MVASLLPVITSPSTMEQILRTPSARRLEKPSCTLLLEGLQQGQLVPELYCFYCWCFRFSRCLCSPRRYQNPYPEPKLRQP
ncbi:hypothetical protein LB505_000625 [Fusarium chuoi]|nr:hypothetical protein LB505_000625 [Fusarium chuoi]